jgi:hypothetical protein
MDAIRVAAAVHKVTSLVMERVVMSSAVIVGGNWYTVVGI